MKKATPKRVLLNICSTPHYTIPCVVYKRNHSMVYHIIQVNVKDVLKVMNIPEEIINQIQFEDENNI